MSKDIPNKVAGEWVSTLGAFSLLSSNSLNKLHENMLGKERRGGNRKTAEAVNTQKAREAQTEPFLYWLAN